MPSFLTFCALCQEPVDERIHHICRDEITDKIKLDEKFTQEIAAHEVAELIARKNKQKALEDSAVEMQANAVDRAYYQGRYNGVKLGVTFSLVGAFLGLALGLGHTKGVHLKAANWMSDVLA